MVHPLVTRNHQPWLTVPIRIPNFWLKNTYRIFRYVRFIYLYQISFASCKLRFKQELCPLTINRRVLAPQESCSAAWRGCCDLNIRPAPPPCGWASTISWALFSLFFAEEGTCSYTPVQTCIMENLQSTSINQGKTIQNIGVLWSSPMGNLCPGSFERLHVLQKSAPPETSGPGDVLGKIPWKHVETMVSILNIPQLTSKYDVVSWCFMYSSYHEKHVLFGPGVSERVSSSQPCQKFHEVFLPTDQHTTELVVTSHFEHVGQCALVKNIYILINTNLSL